MVYSEREKLAIAIGLFGLFAAVAGWRVVWPWWGVVAMLEYLCLGYMLVVLRVELRKAARVQQDLLRSTLADISAEWEETARFMEAIRDEE